jgi:choline dehydrogenase
VSRTESRGSLALRPGRPTGQPLIDPAYLQSEADWRTLERGLELSQEVAATRAAGEFRPRGRGLAVPDGVVTGLPRDRAERRRFIAATLTTTWHPGGTCKMGRDDRSVVDPELRVHGLGGLRVADASIMPELPSANINAACIMIGEKCADLLSRRRASPVGPIPSSDAPPIPELLAAVLRGRRTTR